MKKFFLIVVVSSFLAGGSEVRGQQTSQKLVFETDYLLYLPDGYNEQGQQKWPLVIFLHGSGLTGNNINLVKRNGIPGLIANGKKFPFIVISPQAKEYGWKPWAVALLVKDALSRYQVDPDRVYLTGLSMGGFGTWDVAMEYPELFAAIIPVCGGADASKAWKLRNMPVWCFHGAKDNVVPLISSGKVMDELKKINPRARFTVYPDADHDSWTATYNNDSVYRWMLAQRRFSYKQVAVGTEVLSEYAGSYLSPQHDTVTVFAKENSLLLIMADKSMVELKPASGELFFFDEHLPNDILFVRKKRRGVDHFVFTADEKLLYKRINTVPERER